MDIGNYDERTPFVDQAFGVSSNPFIHLICILFNDLATLPCTLNSMHLFGLLAQSISHAQEFVSHRIFKTGRCLCYLFHFNDKIGIDFILFFLSFLVRVPSVKHEMRNGVQQNVR